MLQPLSKTTPKELFGTVFRFASAGCNNFSRPRKQAGLTLIECLVAIAVIASTIGVIAPVTVLAVATRVRNQRAEQAAHLAQAEVDRVRFAVERDKSYTADLNTRIASVPDTVAIEDAEVPVNIDVLLSTPPASPVVNIARSVDIDRDGAGDFAVQIFRSSDADSILSDAGELTVFDLGVRVYRYSAIENSASSLGKEQASLTFTSGEGEATTRPLAVLYTTIVKGDEKESLCDYYEHIDSTATTPGACS